MPAPLFTPPEPTGRSARSARSARSGVFPQPGPYVSSGPYAPYVPSGPSEPSTSSYDRSRLGPRGLLSRRRGASSDLDGSGCRRTRPPRVGDGAPERPASPLPAPLPSALLPLPAGFELNRDPAASVVPA
ncbi:hypothetical protein [Streptomyces sediminimaris]|uniref:hypothetical protein n=1 Tax=Streptomyces sediminimaris TaxID=3383721 RepID=UPI00399BF474